MWRARPEAPFSCIPAQNGCFCFFFLPLHLLFYLSALFKFRETFPLGGKGGDFFCGSMTLWAVSSLLLRWARAVSTVMRGLRSPTPDFTSKERTYLLGVVSCSPVPGILPPSQEPRGHPGCRPLSGWPTEACSSREEPASLGSREGWLPEAGADVPNAWRLLWSWKWARHPAHWYLPQAVGRLLLAQAWLTVAGYTHGQQLPIGQLGKGGWWGHAATGLAPPRSCGSSVLGKESSQASVCKHFPRLLVLHLPISHGPKPHTRPAQNRGQVAFSQSSYGKVMGLWRGRQST